MNDGRIQYLCSSKCRKNMLMHRRKIRWIKKSDAGKEVNSQEKIIESKIESKEEAKEHKNKQKEGK